METQYVCMFYQGAYVQNDTSHYFLLGTLLSSNLFAAISDEGPSKDLQYPGTEGPSHTNPPPLDNSLVLF